MRFLVTVDIARPREHVWALVKDVTQRVRESAKRVPEAIRRAHPTIEWRSMARMRDRLVHDDFGADLDIVWDVLQTKIPPLRDDVRAIVDSREATD